ncbi:MAG: prepilin peptidase [Deltaproteobacteria bacterium]|nr:prepilin peptidase [Deltaproteobacteria bacterium]MBW1986111.1 prepilin peptidase [Deltaproteobacteria bacterium]MBW2134203.1 prepilin peptidase [Deltaproteobacteria bacterium]
MIAYLLAFLAGLALGSFLNVVITRLPQGEPVWAGRSRCPQCRHPIPWYDNLPIISFIWLKGRCRFCQGDIPWRYPAVELAGGLLALGLWARFPGEPLLFAYGPFTAALVILTGLDLEHQWLPDIITLPGIALGLVLALILPHLSFSQALAGAVAGAALLQAIGWGYGKVTGRQGLGGGDVKLLALIGAFLGLKSIPVVILISATLGSLGGGMLAWKSGQGRLTPIPFGPFLGLAALVYLFAEPDLLGLIFW